MKSIICLVTIFLIFVLTVSDAIAQSKYPVIADTVLKIKEDDDGKLIILAKSKPILYLKYKTKNYDSIYAFILNSQSFNSAIKITTDSQLNVIKAD